jgi:2-hydroxy-6-oxonona-2,4-dienedioate hydrolase
VGTNEVTLAGCPHEKGSRESQAWFERAMSYDSAHVTDQYVELGYEVLSLPKSREAVRKMEEEGLKLKLFLPMLAKMKEETLGWIADRGMKRPTQIIWARNDKTAVMQRGRALFDIVAAKERRAYFHAINQSGHFVFREQPKQFNEIVIGFLRSIGN